MSDTPDTSAKSFRSTVLIFALLSILAIALSWNHIPFDKSKILFWADDSIAPKEDEPLSNLDATMNFHDASESEPLWNHDHLSDKNQRDDFSLSGDESGPYQSTSYQSGTPFHVEGERGLRTPQHHTQTAYSAEAPKREQLSSQKLTPPVSQDYLQYQTLLERNYGATETHLEYWGSDGKLVRFTCYVPSRKLNRAKKHFHTIAATPLEAIKKIASEVQLWYENEE